MSEEKSSGGPMGRGGGLGQKTEKAKNFKGTMLHLAGYLKHYKVSVIVVILFACCSSVFSIVGPKVLGKATTKLFEGLMAWAMGTGLLTDFRYIRNRLLLLVVLYLVSALFSYLQSYIMSGVSMKITYELRKNISEKMNRLPLNYYDTRTHGEILSRITNDVDTVSQTLNQSLTQMITSVTTLIGIVAMMLSISVRMTLVAVLVLFISMGLIVTVVKKSQKYFSQQQKSLGNLNGHIEEIYAGHNVVQIFNGEKEAIEKFRLINDKLYGSAWKSQFLSGMMMPIMSFVGNLGFVCVCLLGGYLTVKKVIEIGDVQAFIQYMRSFMQPISQIANVSNTLQSTAAAAERVFEFLDEEDEVSETESPIVLSEVHGNVEFKKVCFGYQPDTMIINHFSSNVEAGQTVAIVGPTGAGKTTIVKLLMRFYELNSGQILIDGHDSLTFTRRDLRAMFGMVLQDTWLYNATVMDNIRYGNFDKTDEEVIAAAKAAHCDEFIRTLPGGYHMVINEESSNLSQGQKQLLTIARTILADPKILILDEATSSIDTRTEVFIQRAMDKLMKNRTSFVIAHRLSTIRDADMILVMKDGDIIEQGNHETLLEKKGFYSDLYHSQFAEQS
ncbi:ATP-binding cassette subfamily B protein [Lacrimispora xylanisolvens]|uniref:ATP-binding cassette subfamily B protein n=1 Tax=Lacrimispora xylanisolvens TaxID=384636 RepID=A0A2S6HNK0_9FIRM|nr:ABC transporter ATP-binding protein [Hungatella xylanolytica]MBE5987356.1 ABC transporter ATP-binding protein [Paenibacillaceae bacterium]PPK78945.1 ATP-binding cassette subfamily B protein [Hungatella xylanolytica]